jgi:hypothetical protein
MTTAAIEDLKAQITWDLRFTKIQIPESLLGEVFLTPQEAKLVKAAVEYNQAIDNLKTLAAAI